MKIRLAQALATLCLLFITVFATAQNNASVRGVVYDKASGEPMPFTIVVLQGTTYGNQTDLNGLYSITRIPPGTYTLAVAALGYDSVKVPITLKANDITSQNIYLPKKENITGIVNVNAEETKKTTTTKVSVLSVGQAELNRIPTVGGQADVAQYMQVLPGVVSSGDQGGQLYIRGGAPVQNKTLLDGMIVYNPFHSIGFYSVFDADIIKNVDVYTGGFGAEYGGRISSIMDVTTRDGNKKRFAGKASINPFTAKLLLETPLKRAKEDGDGSSSLLLSGKTAYLNRTAPALYSYADTAGLPFSFTDIYGKLSFNGPNGSKLNLFGMNFADQVQYRSSSRLAWNNTGFGTNFILIPNNSNVIFEGNVAYSAYRINLDEEDQAPRFSGINGFNMGLGFKQFVGRNEFKYGLEIIGFRTDFNFTNAVGRLIAQNDNTTEGAAYFKTRILLGKGDNNWGVLEPSFRAHYYASLSEFSPEPRLSLKGNITKFLRIKAATGLYSQNLMAANSDRDVVNLFYGFLSSPQNLQKQFEGRDVNSALQRAQHAILGFEVDAGKYITINVEGYYINFSQLTNVNRNKIYEDNLEFASQPDVLKKDFIIERGNSRGVDLTVKVEKGRLYLWVVYSLMYTDRFDGVINYKPIFDRRHNLNVVASYNFGKSQLWQLDARWNYGSGFPFTQTQGFYNQVTFNQGINTDYTSAQGQLGTIFAPLNQGRLPQYHRFDLSLRKRFLFSENASLDAVASCTNVYNRDNIFYFDRVNYRRLNQLPILPTLGLSFSF